MWGWLAVRKLETKVPLLLVILFLKVGVYGLLCRGSCLDLETQRGSTDCEQVKVVESKESCRGSRVSIRLTDRLSDEAWFCHSKCDFKTIRKLTTEAPELKEPNKSLSQNRRGIYRDLEKDL